MRPAFSKNLPQRTRVLSALTGAAIILSFGFSVRAQQADRPKGVNPAAQQLQVRESVAPHEAPEQPLPFSHKTHVSRGVQCRLCHTNPEPGNQMTFPAVATCMGCHKTIATDRPAIRTLAGFAQSGQAIPWVRVYQVTKGVTWTHRKHLEAGLQCGNCHGPVGEMEKMAMTTAVTTMGNCISCHQSHNAPSTCQTCHAWPAEK
jgi:Cytochrome c7 and related cytochrome c